jgi:tRNA threonylcarbamoyladenosine biosynthesis protein TsaB
MDGDSFRDILDEGTVLFIGDGADKCRGIIDHPNARFLQCCPSAWGMAIPATREFEKKNWRDVAYFEPFYLKEFVTTVSKKKLF